MELDDTIVKYPDISIGDKYTLRHDKTVTGTVIDIQWPYFLVQFVPDNFLWKTSYLVIRYEYLTDEYKHVDWHNERKPGLDTTKLA